MLFKAIVTGGVLSVLAGVGVYYGTEGADVLDVDKAVKTSEKVSEEAVAEVTELAGGTDVFVGNTAVEAEAVDAAETVKTVEAQDPPKESKPKTKWLDQYLKKAKSKTEEKVEVEAETQGEAMVKAETETHGEVAVEVEAVEIEVEIEGQVETAMDAPAAGEKETRRIRIKRGLEGENSGAEVTGTYVVSKRSRSDTQDLDTVENDTAVIDGIDLDAIDLGALNLDGDIDIDALKNQLGLDGKENVEVRVIKKTSEAHSKPHKHMKKRKTIDYDLVLAEAKKLLVIDMKNQAVLEIVDYAVDNGDMAQAAGLLEELSTPELRDTARARIGAGLARRGNADAAFAVLEELEIDELSAPIRLEIITALMATKQERKARKALR